MAVNYPHSESFAFQQALLRSERLRILIVLGTIATAFLLRTIRTVAGPGGENLSSWLITLELFSLFAIYECFLLIAVNRAIRNGQDLGNSVWVSNIVVETFLPALGLVLVSSPAIDVAYRPLANPAVLVFFIFIILSVLRLNPALCWLSGFVAASSYLAASAYLGWRPSFGETASVVSPQKAVFGYALTLIIAGFVAGAVAGEVRKQVDAALREAEARRKVERLEHDLEFARSIQQSLLPSGAPEIEGFEIAGWNRPADQTGGDYYDWQCRPDGSLVVALADVTGHGIGPALLAAACRAYARASFHGCGALMPAMEQINTALAGDTGEGQFVTFVTAVCTPGCSHVEMLSAGHGPLFLYVLKEDRFEEMGAQALPLGIIADFVSEPPKTLNLSPGDLLVLATDGFSEWANPAAELFGQKRLQHAIRTSRLKHPGEIISDLYQAVIEFSGGTKQQDDLTAVIIKRR
jgi:serine phosphatase RsbU (regulator of sigma subunit)